MKRYEYEGELLTISEISTRTGIKSSKIRYRLKHKQPVTGPTHPTYTFNDMTMTIKEWSEHLGINVTTLRTRLRYNLPYEKVFCSEKIKPTGRSKSGIYFDPVSGHKGTRAEMAQLFEVTPQTIHLWAKEGKLEKNVNDEHEGETRSGWLIIKATDTGLLCECEICSKTQMFKSIDVIRKCENPEHKMINARKRLMGKIIKNMKIVEVVKAAAPRNIRVLARCNACEKTFPIWEANMYKGCRCQK